MHFIKADNSMWHLCFRRVNIFFLPNYVHYAGFYSLTFLYLDISGVIFILMSARWAIPFQEDHDAEYEEEGEIADVFDSDFDESVSLNFYKFSILFQLS